MLKPAAPPLQDTPLDGMLSFDLATPEGMARLRHFDARLRRLGDAAAQRAAVRRLSCIAPLANRAAGPLVLPGGALALRQGDRVLVPDPASAIGVWGGLVAALWHLLPGLPGLVSVTHGPAGLARVPGLPPVGAVQAATLLPEGAALSPVLPEAAGWSGPALLRWCPGGAVAWAMVPAAAALALGVSVAGEPLAADGPPIPREAWDAPEGDDRFPLLSTGLFAHLDELLGNEVSDLLRYELVDHWTDGEDSLASQLADGLGLLPACFASPWEQPVGAAALAPWPRAAALLPAAEGPRLLLGIAAAAWGEAWRPARRHAFLRAARQALPEGLLVPEDARCGPYPLGLLAADRQMRAGAGDAALLGALPASPATALRLGQAVAEGCGAPVQLVVPCWGIAHRCEPGGGPGQGNAAWYGAP
ncbi:hypothetical protein NON00_08450 [Roseomonas sp. GC11]|uniref:hypothetical protein n=1 Tax=Roseomonas sp. GC11 TaxID=2950546 RepID=UPI00210A33D1|nr:hypothetical protein [Roseomonas sp. GC11]MCQ4159959.1 hypothetical protein [Roseomonas sp. GC11]